MRIFNLQLSALSKETIYRLTGECKAPSGAFKIAQVTFFKLWSHELNNDVGKFKIRIVQFGIEIGGIESRASETRWAL